MLDDFIIFIVAILSGLTIGALVGKLLTFLLFGGFIWLG